MYRDSQVVVVPAYGKGSRLISIAAYVARCSGVAGASGSRSTCCNPDCDCQCCDSARIKTNMRRSSCSVIVEVPPSPGPKGQIIAGACKTQTIPECQRHIYIEAIAAPGWSPRREQPAQRRCERGRWRTQTACSSAAAVSLAPRGVCGPKPSTPGWHYTVIWYS
jgi:hypothetical protein